MDWLTGGRQAEAKRLIAQLSDSTKRDRAARELIALDAEAVPALLETLQTSDLNLLSTVQQILARIHSATPSLVKVLATAHPLVRGRAAEVLGIGKDRKSIPALLEALTGEYFTVRSRAASALGNIGDPKVIPHLLPLLKDAEDEVRIAACLALGKFNDPTTFDDITNVLLDDAKIEVRQAAARALGSTKHPKAIPYLMEALHDPFWWYEREQAAGDLLSAIENMGGAAVDPLIESLQDKEGAVRKFAVTLLGRVKDPRALEPLSTAQYDLHHEVGKTAAEALAQFGAPAIPLLTEALRHPEMWIRIHAVRALGMMNDSQIIPILLEMLNDPEREVKKHTIKSLSGRKDAAVMSALEIIANNRADRELATLARQSINSG